MRQAGLSRARAGRTRRRSRKASGSSTCGMWLDSGKTCERTSGMRLTKGSHTDGIASSCAPATTSVGTAMPPSRSTTAPVLEGPDDVELARAVHRVVDGRVLLELGEGVEHLRRVGRHPADVPVVEDLHRREVLRGVRGAGLLVAGQRLLHLDRAAGCAGSPPPRATAAWTRGCRRWSGSAPRAGRRGRTPGPSIPPQDCPSRWNRSPMPRAVTRRAPPRRRARRVQKRGVGVRQVGAARRSRAGRSG